MLKTFILLITALVFLSGCSSPPLSSPSTVNSCNKQKKECNDKAHEEACGASQIGGCVEKIVTDENWDSSDFEKKIRQCDSEYSQCLNRDSKSKP